MPICKLSQRALASALLAWAVVVASPAALAQQPATPPKVAATPVSTPPVDAARAGTATVLRNGKAIGLGMVLGTDGRVVGSRASLGGSKKGLALRFADGSTVAATVGHEDAGADLVLLVPERVSWIRGHAPSQATVNTGTRLSFFQLSDAGLAPVTAGNKRASALQLPGATQSALGSPVLDEGGGAVGVVTLSCDPPEGKTRCVPTAPRLAPVAVLRGFLRTIGSAPTAASAAAAPSAPVPWLGVRGERAIGTHARGVRVVEVGPGSPAATAKLVSGPEGDLVLGVAGEPVTSEDELTAAIRKHPIGKRVALTLFSRASGYRQVDVVLGRAPAGAAGAVPQAGPPAPRSPSDGAPKDFDSRR